MKKLILLALLAFINLSAGSRILAYLPLPTTSHQHLFRPILQGVAAKGHQITLYTSMPMAKPHANIQQIVLPSTYDKMQEEVDILDMGEEIAPKAMAAISDFGYSFGEFYYSTPEVQELIHSNEKYDMVILESIWGSEPTTAFCHKFNALCVDIIGLGDYSWANELSGLPDNPAYMLDIKSFFTDDMTFFQKLHNSYITYSTTLVGYYYLPLFQKQMDKYFNYTGWESRPPIAKLMSDKALILYNSHHSLTFPSPKPPHAKEVGGAHITEPKTMPKDLQTFMDEAKDGVILFSFGTYINMTEFYTKRTKCDLVKVFGGLKQRVLWKWGSDELPKVPPNVRISKWLPQQEILAHKNTKAFITHGGYLSVSEAVHYGVPLVGIPFFMDQFKNMIHAIHAGYGVQLDRRNLNEGDVTSALNEVITNPRYKEQIKKVSALFRDRHMKPVDEAVYWIEYVLRHGKVLQPRSVHLSFCAMHMLDIYGVVILGLYIIYKSIKCSLCWFHSKKHKSTTPKSKRD